MGEEERGASKPQREGSISKLQDGYAGIRGVFTSTLPESVQHGISTANRLNSAECFHRDEENRSTEKSNDCPKDILVNERRFQNID